MSVANRQAELLEMLGGIPDRQERLAAVVERARRRPPFTPTERTPINRVAACSSAVWLTIEANGNHLSVRGDAEAPVVRGLVNLLCELYDGGTVAEILTIEPTLLADLGLLQDLSPTRRHGIQAVRDRLRALAAQHGSPG